MALESRPEGERTRIEYERVLNAYRAIYHGDPGASKADASIDAVAELLAEEGRLFAEKKRSMMPPASMSSCSRTIPIAATASPP